MRTMGPSDDQAWELLLPSPGEPVPHWNPTRGASTVKNTRSAFVPFGGAKESGVGRQCSALGLKSCMEHEVVSIAN